MSRLLENAAAYNPPRKMTINMAIRYCMVLMDGRCCLFEDRAGFVVMIDEGLAGGGGLRRLSMVGSD